MDIAEEGVIKKVKHGELITIKQASKSFGVPEQTIRAWVRAGYIERVYVSPKRILVSRRQVEDCILIYRPRPGARKTC